MKTKLLNMLCYTIGCAIFAAALAVFIVPNELAPGGVSGLAVTLNHVTRLPVGVWTLLLNLPLLILAFRFIGRGYAVRTLICVVLSSSFIWIGESFLPGYTGDRLLSCMIGGAVMGAGLALVLMRGASTGGTDVAGALLTRRWPFVPLGKMMLIVDGLIITVSACVFRSVETALYSFICVFVTSTVLDNVLCGTERGKLVYIISDHGSEIAQSVLNRLRRGCTLLSAKGAYSGTQRPVVLVAVRRTQVYPLKRLVNELDPTAFFMVTDYSEVVGAGFKEQLL